MSFRRKGSTTSVNVVYSLVPAHPLPTVDLSKSFRGRLLPASVHTYIRRRYYKYYREVLLCAALSYCLNAILPVVKAPVGRVLALLAVLLWMPVGLGSITTLRYDIVRLVSRTFDFWFFSAITSVITVTMSMYFGDLRSVRMLIDWIGYHHVICVDAHVLGLKSLTYFLIASILSASIVLAWIMFGHVDGGSAFSIMKYENMHGIFELSGLDVIGNGLVSLGLLLARIVFRKRKVLRSRCKRSSTIVECAIYRCRLKLEPLRGPTVSVAWARDDPKFDSKESSLREADIVQHLSFIRFQQTFDATNTLLPWKFAQLVFFPNWLLVVLYIVGAAGLLTSHALLIHELNELVETESDEQLEVLASWMSLLCTIIFTTSFAAFYERRLLKLLFSSFDFAFYSLQITSADICVCSLYGWDQPQCLMVLSWWLWAHWVFTLDALTPAMRRMLKFRVHVAAPIFCLLLLDHIVLICQIFFVADTKLQESVIFEGTVWRQQFSIRAIPFYVSRSLTLFLWCLRLIARLGSSSDDDVAILRGTVCYDNFFAKGRLQSSQINQIVEINALAARTRVSPVTSFHQENAT